MEGRTIRVPESEYLALRDFKRDLENGLFTGYYHYPLGKPNCYSRTESEVVKKLSNINKELDKELFEIKNHWLYKLFN
jgi:hypothetical protein